MEQLERNRRLLRLKGVAPADAVDEPLVPERVLQQFRQRKAVKLDAAAFDAVQLRWNMDGTLDTLTVDNDAGGYRLQFVWNADGSLSEVLREPRS